MARLQSAIVKSLKDPAVTERLTKIGFEVGAN